MDAHALARKHLDRRFAALPPAQAWARPPKGWVRAIRDALGMTRDQLGARMGLSAKSTIAGLESGEVEDTVTLASLRKAADALDCVLVYALVPKVPLEDMVRQRAERVAGEHVARVGHTMDLEGQAVGRDELAAERTRMAGELTKTHSRRLWDNP